jgi:aryl-alcohol dehydrogenase-like predicted oxidoreductase
VAGCRVGTGKAHRRSAVRRPGGGKSFPGTSTPNNPANAAKLAAADALGALADDAGITLVQMAIAFVTRHPAVTSAIIGPRTSEQLESYLAADGIELSDDVLDRIDEIVPPAVSVNIADTMWFHTTTVLGAAYRRGRATKEW